MSYIKWIRTPQVLGSRPGGYGTFSTELLTDYHHTSIIKLCLCWCVWMVGKDFPIRSDQDIKMGSCVFQCDIPHQWIAQPISPISVYCDGVRCHVLCLRHGIPVRQHIGQSTTDKRRHSRDMTSEFQSDIKPLQTQQTVQQCL